MTAGAAGVLQQQARTVARTGASQSLHRLTKQVDVAPLSRGDRSGLSSFVFGLGLVIPSVIGSVGLFLLGMRLRLWRRVAAGALFALLAACGGVLAIDTVLRALPGATAALIGIGFLGALSFMRSSSCARKLSTQARLPPHHGPPPTRSGARVT